MQAVSVILLKLASGASGFSDLATTDRGWVSGNTSGYKGRASEVSIVVLAQATICKKKVNRTFLS